MSDSVVDPIVDASKVFHLVEIALAARTLYGFCRTYFAHRLLPSASSKPTAPLITANPSATAPLTAPPPPKKPVVVYMDGCFDVMHFGHANALRQARALGDILVVGLCPDNEILENKGPPVMNNDERLVAVSSVKWVDKVITNVPYDVTQDFLEQLINEYGIDIIVHGDDPCIGKDGQDVYKAVKEMGRFRTIKRTEGVSSTDIVGRMLLSTRDHHVDLSGANSAATDTEKADSNGNNGGKPFTRKSKFLPTTRRLIQFAGTPRAPRLGDRVVYVDGTFDMFHAGHIETLRHARELGDFLLVGIHDDATVNERKGSNFPIMNLHERVLGVLSCRHVDEVIIGAPAKVTKDMITTMNITYVVHGSYHGRDGMRSARNDHDFDPYEVAREMGIVRKVESTNSLCPEEIVNRIVNNREAYVKRNKKKAAAEEEYLEKHKSYVVEG